MNAPSLILLTAGAVLGGIAFVGKTTEELGADYTDLQGPPSPSKDYPGKPIPSPSKGDPGKPMIAPLRADERLPTGVTPLPRDTAKKAPKASSP